MIPLQCKRRLRLLGRNQLLILIAGPAVAVLVVLSKTNIESIRVDFLNLIRVEAEFASQDRADLGRDKTGVSPREHAEIPGVAPDGAIHDGAREATRNLYDAARSQLEVRLEVRCQAPRMVGDLIHYSCEVEVTNPSTSTVYGIELEADELARMEQLGPVRWHPDILPGGRRLRASYGDGSFHVLIAELRAGETARASFNATGQAGDSRTSEGIQLARGR